MMASAREQKLLCRRKHRLLISLRLSAFTRLTLNFRATLNSPFIRLNPLSNLRINFMQVLTKTTSAHPSTSTHALQLLADMSIDAARITTHASLLALHIQSFVTENVECARCQGIMGELAFCIFAIAVEVESGAQLLVLGMFFVSLEGRTTRP
jgi:hypothetical protein